MTIRELAEELQVSKTAVQKTIDKLDLRGKLQKEGNKYIVPEIVADQIRLYYSGEAAPETKGEPAGDPDRDILIDLLRAEIEEKNQQIRELHLILQQNQLLLAQATQGQKDSAEGQPVEAEEQPIEAEPAQDHAEQPEETPVKKGFWSRLFGL